MAHGRCWSGTVCHPRTRGPLHAGARPSPCRAGFINLMVSFPFTGKKWEPSRRGMKRSGFLVSASRTLEKHTARTPRGRKWTRRGAWAVRGCGRKRTRHSHGRTERAAPRPGVPGPGGGRGGLLARVGPWPERVLEKLSVPLTKTRGQADLHEGTETERGCPWCQLPRGSSCQLGRVHP